MRVLLKEVFKNHEFSKNFEEQFREKTVIDEIVDVFVNKYDEMYFIIFGKLQRDTLSQIIDLCAEVEKNQFYKKSWKSNWVVLYITELATDLTNEQKKIVMQIEENKFFCRKYVFWYTDEEKEALKKLCENDFSKETLKALYFAMAPLSVVISHSGNGVPVPSSIHSSLTENFAHRNLSKLFEGLSLPFSIPEMWVWEIPNS